MQAGPHTLSVNVLPATLCVCARVCAGDHTHRQGVSWGPWLWVTTRDNLCVHFAAPL